MSDEQLFRTILIVSALLLFPVTIYRRIKSESTGESLDRWQEGAFILFTLDWHRDDARAARLYD